MLEASASIMAIRRPGDATAPREGREELREEREGHVNIIDRSLCMNKPIMN
jgi:hypothetical protein